MDAWIVLGCHGYRWYGMSMCKGTTNQIADLAKLGQENEEILSYLDAHCKLFDRVVDDLNVIGNVVNFLNRYGIIQDHLVKVIHGYISMHKHCGLYMFVDPKTARPKQ